MVLTKPRGLTKPSALVLSHLPHLPRLAHLALLAFVGACSGGGAAPARSQPVTSDFELKDGARPITWQASTLGYSVAAVHAASFDARLAMFETNAVPMLKAIAASPYRLELDVTPKAVASRDGGEYFDYAVDARLVRRGSTKKGATDPGALLAQPPRDSGLDPAMMQRGFLALTALVTMQTELGASDDTIRRYAFGLLVIRARLEKGEHVDATSAMRSPAESLKDVDLALRATAEHFETTASYRAQALALVAFTRRFDVPAAQTALTEELADSRARAQQWKTTHVPPTEDDFNVGLKVKPRELPPADNFLAILDKDGYLTAALELAQGVATGRIATSIQALGKFAPKGSSWRVASEGLAAAARGDLSGAATAALDLAGRIPATAPLAARLESVRVAVGEIQQGIAEARGVARGTPSGIADAQGRIDRAAAAGSKVVGGAARVVSPTPPKP